MSHEGGNGGVGARSMAARRYWTLATLIYMTLIYATAVHYAYGSERTINLTFFTWPRASNPLLQERFPDKARWSGENLEDVNSDFVPIHFWKLTSLWGDAGHYILQSRSIHDSIPPFKYRIVPTLFAGLVASLTRIPIPIVFAVMNCVLTLVTALLFTRYLLQMFKFSKLPSLVGGILFVTMFANTQTIPFPMLEPASFLFAVLIFMAIHRRSWRLFIPSAALGVATKEILIVASLLWVINAFVVGNPDSRRWTWILVPALVPVGVLFAVRLALGGDMLEVNYGFNLLEGAIPLQYVARLLTPVGVADVVVRTFLAFSFLWCGLVNIRRDPFLSRNLVFIPVVIVATILLSSRISRNLGILFPMIIPAFLMFIEDPVKGLREAHAGGNQDVTSSRGAWSGVTEISAAREGSGLGSRVRTEDRG